MSLRLDLMGAGVPALAAGLIADAVQGADDGLTAAELDVLDGALVGTVVASKAAVVDANKDIASFRDVTVRKIIVGDSANDHTITIAGAGNESANRTLDIPLLAGNDTIVTLATAQTLTGIKTMSGANVITHAPTGLKVQDSNASHVVTIAAGDEAADRTLSIPVLGGADTIVTLGASQTITGNKVLSGTLTQGSDATDRIAIKGFYYSPANVSVSVPSITDPDIARVQVDVSAAFSMQPAVGDIVIAIPMAALPTNARLQGAWIYQTDGVEITFGSEGGNVTGAATNFRFLIIDVT